MALPARRTRPRMGIRNDGPLESPAHRAFVRKHQCCVPGCEAGPIQAHHVRKGNFAGERRKPDDAWCVSLCSAHHDEGHTIGWDTFEAKYQVNLRMLALEFAAKSPAWQRRLKRHREERHNIDLTKGHDYVEIKP